MMTKAIEMRYTHDNHLYE